MPRPAPRALSLLLPLLMAVAISCDVATSPPLEPFIPGFAQGDGGTWTVNTLADPGDGTCDDTDCTLREAIAAAASGDRIVFAGVLQGSIQLTAGQLAIVDKDLAIDGDGRIEIDAQRTSRVLDIVFNEGPRPAVALAGLTLRNGFTDARGGGIRTEGRALSLDDVTVDGNESLVDGGGIATSDADVTIRNSLITNNIADERGGGIFSFFSDLTLSQSTVDDNETNGDGGGIFATVGDLEVIASTLSRNSAPDGNGGGIFNDASATIVRSTISGNTADGTAAIFNLDTLNLRSTTITLNRSLLSVGGISMSLNAQTTVASSIIAGNETNSGLPIAECNQALDGFVSLGYNVTTDSKICPFNGSGDQVLTTAQVFSEVLEEQLADHGGPTMTHALIARGRAVDAGYCPGESEDQRGFSRPVDDPVMPDAVDACDVGAYELQGPVAAVADLMISQAVDKTGVKQGELLTYTVRVQNLGPETAPNVVVTDLLSSGVTFVEARHNKGTHTAPPRGETGTVTWYLGDMADQDNEVAEIVVTVLVKGKTTITNTATVTSDASDPNDANNSASIRVSVGAGSGRPKR